MHRRHVLQAFGTLIASSPLAVHLARAAEVKEIRIGYQKAGLLTAIKQRQTLEAIFKPLGITVNWVEFAFGPPILEGINTGNLDFGFTGDAPPIFAQAASANLLYAAALPTHYAEGILVQENSPIKTLADLKGKKIGYGKASSAHTTVLYALEKGGLAYSDVQNVFLAPADGAAAFARGSIDAWAIWDPYLSIAEQGKARTLAYASDVHQTNHFFLANKAFATQHGDLLTKLLDGLAVEIKWASEHHAEVAQGLHDASGIDLQAFKAALDRAHYVIEPVSETTIKTQQDIADRYFNLHLLPKPVVVRDLVWKWTPSA